MYLLVAWLNQQQAQRPIQQANINRQTQARGWRESPEVVQCGVQQLVDHRNFQLGLHPIVVQCLLKPVVFVPCDPMDDLLRHPRE